MTSYSLEYSCILFGYFRSIEEHLNVLSEQLKGTAFCIQPVWELLGASGRIGVAVQNSWVIELWVPNHFAFCCCWVHSLNLSWIFQSGDLQSLSKQSTALPNSEGECRDCMYCELRDHWMWSLRVFQCLEYDCLHHSRWLFLLDTWRSVMQCSWSAYSHRCLALMQ